MRFWTEKELDILRREYDDPQSSFKKIERLLKMGRNKIQYQAQRLGLKRSFPIIYYRQTLWKKSDIAFMKRHGKDMTAREIATKLGKSISVIRPKLYELGLKKMELEYWTVEQVQFLKENYKAKGNSELADIFEERWPKKKKWTIKHIEKKMVHMGLKRSIKEQFLIRTQRFNPADYKDFDGKSFPQGKERIWYSNGKAFRMIKVGKDFVKLHRYNWEQRNGKIPKNKKLMFIDGNTLNCEPENLKLVTQKQLARTISKNIHAELSDSYVASVLARVGSHHVKIDRDVKAKIMQMPDLIEIKRKSLLLNRQLTASREG